jgi:hypothetical protein
MIVQELASGAAGEWVAAAATGSDVGTRAAHVQEVIELIAGRRSAAGTNIAARSIGEVAEIWSFAAARATDIARPCYVAATRTGDVVAARGWQLAEGLPAAGRTLKGCVAAAWSRHRRRVAGKITAAGSTATAAAAASAEVSPAAATTSASAAPAATKTAPAATAAGEQVARNPNADCC